ncbi:MAG TPA: LysR substrate-binding domain-containing protein, partial [Paraburkholderia sp.]|nr:LysR substrate-binding domain-containing protein [Paraburkholderia sp.]
TMRTLPEPVRRAMSEQEGIFIANTTTLLSAVEGGVGLTVLPYLAQQSHRDALRFIALDEPRVERAVGFIELTGRSLSPAANALRESFLVNLDSSPLPPHVRRLTNDGSIHTVA